MKRILTDRSGITLVETLVSVAIMAMAITSAMSMFMVAQSSSAYMGKWEEQTQNLRVGMKQVMDDIAFGQVDDTATGTEVTVNGYRVYADRSNAYWAVLPEWPGDFSESAMAYPVQVKLKLEGSNLVREVRTDGFLVSRRLVAANLVPYSSATSGSMMKSQGNVVTVRLQSIRENAGVNNLAEIYTEAYLP